MHNKTLKIFAISITLLLCFSCNKPEKKITNSIYIKAINDFNTDRDSCRIYFELYRNSKNIDNKLLFELKANSLYKELEFSKASNLYLKAANMHRNNSKQFKLLLRAANTAQMSHRLKKCDSILNIIKTHRQIKSNHLKAEYLGVKGIIFNRRKKFKKAISYLDQSIKILKKDSLNRQYIFYLNYLSMSYYKQGKIGKASEYLVRSIKLARKKNINYILINQYYKLSKMFRIMHKNKYALEWGVNYYNIASKLKLKYDLWRASDNLGIIYTTLGKKDSSETYFNKAINHAENTKRKQTLAIAYTNRGHFYKMHKKYKKASKDLQTALNIRIKNKIYRRNLIKNYIELADLKFKKNKIDSSFILLKNALKISSKTKKSKNIEIDIYKKLSDISFIKKEYKTSCIYLKEYNKLKSILNSKKQNDILSKNLIKFQTKEREIEILKQKTKLDKQHNTIILLIIVCFLLYIIASLIYRIAKKKIIYNKLLLKKMEEEYNKSKALYDSQIIKPENNINTKDIETANTKDIILNKLNDSMENESYRNPEISLKSLACELATNTTYLSQVINQNFGCNFKTFIQTKRILWCKIQLDNKTNLSSEQLCFKAGFKSTSTFYAAFKSYLGETPTSYKKSVETNI